MPRLRFPEFREKGEWESKPLKAIANAVMGSAPSSGMYNTDGAGLPFMQGNADIKNGLSAPRLFTSQVIKECAIGDILLSVRAPVGTVAKSIHNACIGRGLAAIKAQPPNNQEFLFQWLLRFESGWQELSQGGTFDAVNSDDVKELPIPLPPNFPEQSRIADCLASLDDIITAQTQKLDALKLHKKGLMQQLFPADGETVPKLRFPEFRGKGEWEEEKGGVLFSNRIEEGATELPIFSVTMNDGLVERLLLRRNIDDITLPEGNKKAYQNDIVYNMMRMWQGASGVAPKDCMVSPAYIVLAPTENVYSPFYGYFLKTTQCLKSLLSHSQGLTKDRLRLYFNDFANIILPHPSHAEQQRIADCLSSLDELISSATQKLETLKRHKKGLLQNLFPVSEITK